MKYSTQARQTSLKIAAVAAACAAVALGLQGCGSSDGAPPVVLIAPPVVAAQVTTAKYNLVIRNAATGALVTDATTVTFSGAGVVSATGAAITSATTSTGLLSLSTGAGVAADATFTVKTQSRAAGWADGESIVTVVASSDVQNIEIRVGNTAQAAAVQASTAPVAAAAASATVASGQLTTPLTVTTAPKTVTSIAGTPVVLVPATVTIPTTAVLTTAAGVQATGALTLSVVSPSVATVEGLAAVPGGTFGITVKGAPAGVPTTGDIDIAGLATFTLSDAAGNRITNFSTPVIARIPVAPGTFNIEETRLLQAGDPFPVYVRNETTNQWDFQVMGVTVVSGTGLAIEFPTNSFSTRAGFVPRTPATRCASNLTFTGRGAFAGNLTAVVVSRGRPSPNNVAATVTRRTFVGSSFGTANFVRSSATGPANGTVIVSQPDGTVVANTSVADLCGAPVVALNIPTPATGSIAVTVREQCADGSSNRVVPAFVGATSTSVALSNYGAAGAVTFSGLTAGTYAVSVGAAGTAFPPQNIVVAAAATTATFLRTVTCTVASGG